MPADLHLHSTASDGLLSPSEVVCKAVACGLTALALTDHDTVNGIAEARKAALNTAAELVPGIELNSFAHNAEVHILGYFIDYHDPYLIRELKRLQLDRDERAAAIVKKLNKLGISLSFEQVREIAGQAPVGRPHIAKAMLDAGLVKSVKEAFDSYLALGKPAYVPRSRLTPDKAISIILKAGGVPVLAHPGLLNRDLMIPHLIEKGLLGIEVFYPAHDRDMVERYAAICRRHNLVMTGGSDCHGPGTGYPEVGSAVTPDEELEKLKNLL